jgi:gliding motility-associated-like protein
MVVRKILILFIILFFTGSAGLVYSQAAYVNTQRGIYQLTGGPGNCDRVLLTNGCGVDYNILSIAIYKDTLYYNTWSGRLKRFKIGVPGSCETLIDEGVAYNAMTVDKNGIIYFAGQDLVRYDPYSKQLINLGAMPFNSAGDLVFFNDKLLLAGYDPYDWSTGIYEIDISDPGESKLYMCTPSFIGLLSYPVSCGNSRYFGLYSNNTANTQLIELDLANKTMTGEACSMPLDILDAASSTETGLDAKISITGLQINKSCQSATGSVQVKAVYPGAGAITYTLDNSTTNTTGSFINIAAGQHSIRTDAPGGLCSADTSFTIAEVYNLITSIVKSNPDNCSNTPGNIIITASSVNGPVTYTLLNPVLSQASGNFINLRGGRYNFRIADTSGCTKDTSIALSENIPIGGCSDIFIPNAFTPNNDGKNDLFNVSLPSTFKEITVQVFNRWGNAVYQGKGNSITWDGNYKGIQQPVGIYIYNLNYADQGGSRKNLKGTLTLIR